MEKFHNEIFERIAPEKQKRILDAAKQEFAAKGFNAANVNIIADNAGISIGSLYKYFPSKDDLFLSLIESGYNLLEDAICEISSETGDIFDKLERILRTAQQHARAFPQIHQIYQDITTEGLSQLSSRLSRKMETITAEFYRTIINQAKKEGLVATDTDERVFSFCIDNLVLLLQFSYTSEYMKERMRIYAGPDAPENDEKVIRGMMRFIKGALSYRE